MNNQGLKTTIWGLKREIGHQLNTNRIFIFLYIAMFSIFAWLSYLHLQKGANFDIFFRDPATLLKFHPLTGVISNIGVILWTGATAILLYVYIVFRRSLPSSLRWFLFWSGLFTFVLMTDDFFLIHESLGPTYLGIKQINIYFIYCIAIIIYLIYFLPVIRRTNYIFLLLSLFFFSLSIGADVLTDKGIFYIDNLYEDSMKFFGIMGWFYYFALFCTQTINPHILSKKRDEAN